MVKIELAFLRFFSKIPRFLFKNSFVFIKSFKEVKMKKIFVCFVMFIAMIFFAACGGSSKPANESGDDSVSNFGKLGQECYPNKSCDEGLLCDKENNVCIEDTDNPSDENNDKDKQPINNNDSDNVIDDNDPINHNDSDDIIDDSDPINHNDSDDVMDDSDVNDNDPIENNDNDDNPSENDDSNGLLVGEGLATKTDLETLTQDEIDNIKSRAHNRAKQACPYNYIQQPEQYDEDGTMYIVDKCEGDLSEPMWLENAAPKVLFDTYGVPSPKYHRIVSMTVDYSNIGSQSNMKIRVPRLIMDVNFVSQSCLSQGDTNTSIIEMTPNATDLSAGCRIDGEDKVPPIETKGTKQAKYLPVEFESLCMSMPNYEMDIYNDVCSTTINEFVWVENVVNKLLPKNSAGYWPAYSHTIKSITRDLNTGVFYMDVTLVNGHNEQMNLHITLNNAKSCIDQCHGKEGCTSHIEPTRQDASKGCIINGEEINTSCPTGYIWNGSACVNPCDPNPCTSITNSNGTCITNVLNHLCGCKSGYYWKDSSCTKLPECSTSSSTPCKDPASGLTWSSAATLTWEAQSTQSALTWDKAVDYCNNLTEGGYSDWHLPTISELRTLIRNCPAMQSGAGCGVTDSCLSWSDCYSGTCSGCESDSSGKYSKLEDSSWLWSSSVPSDRDNLAVGVNFSLGNVTNDYKSNSHYVRCVR